MPRRPKVSPPCSSWRAYLRGRLASVGLLDDRERAVYLDPSLPTIYLAAFTLGATAAPDAPLLSEVEVGAAVAAMLAPPIPIPIPTSAAIDPSQLPNLPAGATELQSGD